MLQPSPVPAASFADRLRTGGGRRALGIGLALLIEALLLLALLSLGVAEPASDSERAITVVNVADEASEQSPEPSTAEAEEQPAPQPAPQQPAPPQPPRPVAAPPKPPVLPMPPQRPPPVQSPPKSTRPPPAPRPAYGPPDRRPSASRDTERVGTAPNGEPLYAAAWYREPTDDELSGYMSTATGPGWGLIACRTAPNYRVEDCVGLAEYPEGAQINRAVLAAAWQFKVRPPMRGGRALVGSWVRIRIDYSIAPR